MKLRLLLLEDCPRSCKWCANQFWDLKSLPIEDQFDQYDEIMLTGGEPMLEPQLVMDTVKKIKDTSNAKIFLYTAKTDLQTIPALFSVLPYIDGLSVTVLNGGDAQQLYYLNRLLQTSWNTSIRRDTLFKINVFENFNFGFDTSLWKIKHKKWFKHKHLPENEVFKRL